MDGVLPIYLMGSMRQSEARQKQYDNDVKQYINKVNDYQKFRDRTPGYWSSTAQGPASPKGYEEYAAWQNELWKTYPQQPEAPKQKKEPGPLDFKA